ncbi:hypothetical protein PENPOL_c021G03643 [Penicillium polonicum]|uniref:Major facilitator superfamily (MFS) profile domain-containing protein n=1 Tax=Penicillium polonicum TaxID=60169 RepID=A0A1V6N7P5_PENPO|nr:hypothetical protein PENPOL_c021G03643 [Penicillium polonicum]
MYDEEQGLHRSAPLTTSGPNSESMHIAPNPRGDWEDGQDPESVPILHTSDESIRDGGDKYQHNRLPSAFAVTIVTSVLIMIVDIVASVPVAPRMVIFEDIICRNYYAAAQDSEGLSNCKIEPIQSELALINGWKDTFETIPGLLVSIPFGSLADRIGRKKVLMLALVGCLLSDTWVATVCLFPQIFPIRMVWLSGLWQLIGGGGAVVMSLCFTLIGDVCSPEQRTTAFSQIHAAVLLSELISVPLGSSLISVNPWIPVIGALAAMAVTIAVALIFTPNLAPSHKVQQSLEDIDIHLSQDELSPLSTKIRDRLNQSMAKWVDASQWISKDICLIFLAFFVFETSRQVTGVLLQYSSVKFNWEYAKASYLISLRAGVNLLVLVTMIPALTRLFCNKWRCRQVQADKYITLISGMSLVVGCIFIFLAESSFILILGQILFAIGFAFTVTARSLLTAMVDQHHLGLVFTSVTAVTYAGLIAGGPLLATAFQWGLSLGRFWVGMPFLVTAILFSLATFAVFAARAP